MPGFDISMMTMTQGPDVLQTFTSNRIRSSLAPDIKSKVLKKAIYKALWSQNWFKMVQAKISRKLPCLAFTSTLSCKMSVEP